MSNPSALYYPHTEISNKNLIKNSLLLWDQVEYITPIKGWTHRTLSSKVFDEAIEIIARPLHPTADQKQKVHQRVSALLKKGLPSWFFLDLENKVKNLQKYHIYPEKLLHETWRLLRNANLARLNSDSDFHVTPYFGLMLMSLLADSCAGETKRKITDRAEAYSWLQRYSTAELDGEYILGFDASQITPAYERLVTISIKVLNTDNIPISTLVSMRKREANSNSSDYRNFRRTYLKKVDEYVEKITRPNVQTGDVKELERQFQIDMEDHLKDLGDELSLSKSKLVFSKEVAVATGAISGALATPITGLTDIATVLGGIGVGALVKAGKEYKAARKKALRSSPMSWLYLANKRTGRFDPSKAIF